MPLQRANITIPVGGLGEDIDARLMPVERLAEVQNGQFDKAGRIRKRKGFTALSTTCANTAAAITPTRGLWDAGVDLITADQSWLYSYDATLAKWVRRGPVGPCTVDSEEKFAGRRSHTDGDAAWSADGTVKLLASTFMYQSDRNSASISSYTYGVVLRGESSDGRPLLQNEVYDESSSQYTHGTSPRCCAIGTAGKVLAMWRENSVSGPGNLNYAIYDGAAPFTRPTQVTLETDCAIYYSVPDRVPFDVMAITSGGNAGHIVVAYISHASKDIELERYDADMVSQVSVSITSGSDFQLLSMAPNADFTELYLVAVKNAASDTIELFVQDMDDLTTTHGATIDTIGSTQTASNLGVCEGEDVNGDTRVVVSYRAGTSTDTEVRYCSTDVNAANAVTAQKIFNALPRSRPFNVGSRFYLVCDTASTHADTQTGDGFYALGYEIFESSFLVELQTGNDNVYTAGADPYFCGTLAVGGAVPYSSADTGTYGYALMTGAAPHTVETGDVRSVMVPRVLEHQQGAVRRHALHEVQLDFGGIITADVAHEQSAIVGGAYVGYYGGLHVEEVGFVMPPMLDDDDGNYPIEVNVGEALAQNTYVYQAIWEAYDELGVLHRSMPSPPTEEITVSTSGYDAVVHRARTSPATNRFNLPGRDMSVVLYRAGPNGTFGRCSPPTRRVNNVDSALFTDDFYDAGDFQDADTDNSTGPPLYTSGGELENVAPVGAGIVRTIGKRVWIAQGSRVQFSKELQPGTATEQVKAPEFSEGLQIQIPRGAACTGIGDLDDKVVIFTASEVYIVSGEGPTIAGTGLPYALSLIADDTGCTDPRSVVSYPGGLMFQGSAGIYEITRGLEMRFAGGAVEDKTATYSTITSATLVPAETEVRFTASSGSAGIVLVYNYELGRWSWWDITNASAAQADLVGGCLHAGRYYVLDSAGTIWQQSTSSYYDAGSQWVTLAIETAWLQAARPGGWQRVRRVIPLCGYLDDHALTVSLKHDYVETADSLDVRTFTDATLQTFPEFASRVQPMVQVRRQKCQAFKVRIEDASSGSPSTGQGYDCYGFTIELGVKRGTAKVAEAQRG